MSRLPSCWMVGARTWKWLVSMETARAGVWKSVFYFCTEWFRGSGSGMWWVDRTLLQMFQARELNPALLFKCCISRTAWNVLAVVWNVVCSVSFCTRWRMKMCQEEEGCSAGSYWPVVILELKAYGWFKGCWRNWSCRVAMQTATRAWWLRNICKHWLEVVKSDNCGLLQLCTSFGGSFRCWYSATWHPKPKGVYIPSYYTITPSGGNSRAIETNNGGIYGGIYHYVLHGNLSRKVRISCTSIVYYKNKDTCKLMDVNSNSNTCSKKLKMTFKMDTFRKYTSIVSSTRQSSLLSGHYTYCCLIQRKCLQPRYLCLVHLQTRPFINLPTKNWFLLFSAFFKHILSS